MYLPNMEINNLKNISEQNVQFNVIILSSWETNIKHSSKAIIFLNDIIREITPQTLQVRGANTATTVQFLIPQMFS